MRKLPAVVLVSFLIVPAAFAASTDIEIEPGPTAMSPSELALAPDPAAGTEHAEILKLEFERDEDRGATAVYSFHLRAKIHSLEARDLADIEIPYRAKYDRVVRWWGRTIQPDGSVQELSAEQLEQQLVARVGDAAVGMTKAALPGVVPGCVIDYGFTLKLDSAYFEYTEVSLQRGSRIDEFRYRWKPSRYLSGAYRVRNGERVNVDVQRDKNSVLIVGRDIPPLALEPMMPPPDALAATVILYYFDTRDGVQDYWKLQAKRRAGNERLSEEVRSAVAGIGLDPTAPLDRRLRAAYDWTVRRIKNTSRLTVEEVEVRALDGELTDGPTILARGEGSAVQIDRLFADVARAVGAEAHLVLATDRRARLWDAELRSIDQFSEVLVAVRDPTAPNADYVFLDPGAGLPYGEVPWWVTGTTALLASKTGASAVVVPASPASQNVRETVVTVRFGEAGLPASASWSVRATGQSEWGARSRLRHIAPHDRRRALDGFCRSGPGVEVVRAEATGLDDPLALVGLECEVELTDLVLDRSYSLFRYHPLGPWSTGLPDLAPGARQHPVVFDFPFVEQVRIEVHAPPAMRPGPATAPVYLNSPFGRYQRDVTVVDGAFRVERKLAILSLAVPPEHYEALRGFVDQVEKADSVPIEFVAGDEE